MLDMELKEMINFLSSDTCFYDFKIFLIDKFHNVIFPKTNVWEGKSFLPLDTLGKINFEKD